MHDSLSLRCRAATPTLGTPDLSAFSGGPRLSDPEASDPLIWLLPDVPKPESAGVALRPRLTRVPAPRFDPCTSSIDLSAWRIGRDRSRWTFGRSARVLAGLAAALPLALTPGFANAGRKAAPEPAKVVGLEFEGAMLWQPILGSVIEVTLGDGVRIKGSLLTQSNDELAVILAPDGVVMRVPKELIIGLRVLATADEAEDEAELSELRAIREAIEDLRSERVTGEPERAIEAAKIKEPQSGKALAVTGIALTGVGATMLSVFAIGNAVDSSFAYYTFPLLIIGNAMMGPGIPLMISGLAMEDTRRQWEQERDVEITMGPTRGGWAGSLSFRW
jgi:hypothetical protein